MRHPTFGAIQSSVNNIGLNDKEKAVELLERAFEQKDIQVQYVASDPSYDPLRNDPRFIDLVRRVGLPQ